MNILKIIYEIVMAFWFIIIVLRTKDNLNRIEELEKEVKKLKGEENKDEQKNA